jgi:xylulose-5-phosphate/fructose-6-phosphate phosphoketolase
VQAVSVKQEIRDKRIEHTRYIAEYGPAMPEIRNWKWSGRS